MSTLRLYDENSHLSQFSATVLSCERVQNGFAVVLDKTAFFPEGGGQYGDRGFIDDATVFDTQISNGIITHFTDKPLKVGSTTCGRLDFARRHAFMQNHSGEHIVSGIVHAKYGFDNVGFHLAENFVTLDFNGLLDRTQLDEIEVLANERVWQNLSVRAYYPNSDELERLEYRSKKELEGAVRIVEIENTDICACCAPHVLKTGEIGIIKLLDTEKMRGGTRIVMKCGAFALKDYQNKYSNIHAISAQLSAKPENAAEAVERLEERLNAEKSAVSELKRQIVEHTVNSFNKTKTALFLQSADRAQLQALADLLHKTYGGVRAVLAPAGEGFAFALCGGEAELCELFTRFKQSFSVRGGGRGEMVQGSVLAEKTALEEFFENAR